MTNRRQAVKLAPGPQGVARDEVARIQRERLTRAMTHVVATVGYEETTVERVLVDAGVSRRTFYELFDDREDCFIAAYDEAIERLLPVVTDAYLDCDAPERRIEAALQAFLDFLAAEPELARMCVVEVFAAGAGARERRAAVMERLAQLVQHALSELRGDDKLDRLSAQALVGAIHELIYLPVDRRDSAALKEMASEIVAAQVSPLVTVAR